ncbi:MAG: hypothetical protein ABFC84_10810 [Veillonellales bacterium]
MELWIVSVTGILLLAAAALWHRSRRWNWKIKLAAAKLNKLIQRRQRDQKAETKLLRQLYSLLHTSIAAGDASVTYQLVDLLKLAFGSQLFRVDEAARLMSLCVVAIHNRQPELAGIIMDGFHPLFRCLPAEALPDAAEQLTVISTTAVKKKYSFILSKAVTCIFALADRTKCDNNPAGVAILQALQVTGILALRRQDADLWRELVVRMSGWITEIPQSSASGTIVGVLSAWLYRIIRYNGMTPFEIITPLVHKLIECDVLTDDALSILFREWGEAAGAACLNPKSELATQIFLVVIEAAGVRADIPVWNRAIKMVGQVSALAATRHGIVEAFSMLFPLLDSGRKLLTAELKFGQYGDGFRLQQLFIVLRETIMLAELKARQSMTISVGEVIAEIYHCWVIYPQANCSQKAIKKYCQLLLLFWQRIRQREAKRSIPLLAPELVEPVLLSKQDRKQLGL